MDRAKSFPERVGLVGVFVGSDTAFGGQVGQNARVQPDGRPTRENHIPKSSFGVIGFGAGQSILPDGLDWTVKPVRRVGLGGQVLSQLEPGTSSVVLAIGLGIEVCLSGRVGSG